MSSSKEYKDYILENLTILNDITYKPMMGEYLLYYKNVLFGGIYDDRLLIKKTKSNEKYALSAEIPYNGAKNMYQIENLEDQDLLKNIIIDTFSDLK